MKRLIAFAALALVAVLALSLPAQAGWQEEAQFEGGLITPLEREAYDVHNYNKAVNEENLFAGYLGEAGILGPSESPSEMQLAECEQDVFKNYLGEAGIVEPLEAEAC